MNYETSSTYHLKVVANVKVVVDKQTDKRTGQKLYAPDLSMQGLKDRYDTYMLCVTEKQKISYPVVVLDNCLAKGRQLSGAVITKPFLRTVFGLVSRIF